MTKTVENSELGKVAVLMGGVSSEREISLQTGAAVLAALKQFGLTAEKVDPAQFDVRDLVNHIASFDRVFIALHGKGGEDGRIQGLLDTCGLPYTGSGVLGSAVAFDKVITKRIWVAAGIPTPEFWELEQIEQLNQLDWSKLPFVLKPSCEGSSFGVIKVHSEEQCKAAFLEVQAFEGKVLVERCIEGSEFTVGILNGSPLPVVEIRAVDGFYDFKAKYQSKQTQYIIPCHLSATEIEKIQSLSLQAFKLVGAQGWGRVDVMQGQDGKFWLLEVNTVPGLTKRSLVPMAAAEEGISFDQLVLRILQLSVRACS